MFNSNCASVPLVANIDGRGNGNGSNGMWGDSAWWIIILLIFAWGGFGNGFGGGNAGGTGYVDSALQRGFDNQSVMNKLNGLENGLCDGFYNVNTTLMNGFHGVDSAICNLGYQTQQGFNQTNIALMQGQNALASQLANCCCENREAISGLRYDLATQSCDTRQVIQTATRDLLENQNNNTRAILDFLTSDKIASLQAENQSLKLSASQANQNSVLMAAMDANKAEILRRTGAEYPTPAYVVQPPTPVNFPNWNAYNCGCGCS